MNVSQIRVAFFGLLIPSKHGVDGFGQLGAAILVDATYVDPGEIESIIASLFAEIFDLSISHFLPGYIIWVQHLLERYLFLFLLPAVRKYGIFVWYFIIGEFPEFKGMRVNQTHCSMSLSTQYSIFAAEMMLGLQVGDTRIYSASRVR
jgi:hypothetical protein